MRILALDAALARCSAGVIVDGAVHAMRQLDAARGHAAILPRFAAEVLAESRLEANDLHAVAVTVGPGSFTGLRAALSLAHGIGLAAGIGVIGVTVGEALRQALPHLAGRALWSAIDSRRGQVFLERDGVIARVALDRLPEVGGRVAVAGDAAAAVAAWLAAREVDVMLTDARLPLIRHVALAAAQRREGALAPLPAQPIYVDPAEARLPAGGLRPPPE
jgi:tRNA threonylcarbamoyl adenosine modification protein YeaZ